jgi:hypothetical protein
LKKELCFEDWVPVAREARTQCKHGVGDCRLCGTRSTTDIVHRARTPDKRTLRRMRRRAKWKT